MCGLWAFLKDERNRTLLSWLGSGLVVLAAGTWAVFVYVFPPDKGGGGKPAVIIVNGLVRELGVLPNPSERAKEERSVELEQPTRADQPLAQAKVNEPSNSKDPAVEEARRADNTLQGSDQRLAALLEAERLFNQDLYRLPGMATAFQRLVETAESLTDLDRKHASRQHHFAMQRADQARIAMKDSDWRLQALGEAVAAFDQDQSEQNRGRVRKLYDQIRNLDRDRAQASPNQQEIIQRANVIAQGFTTPQRGPKPIISLQERR